ncbi:hypothetical protein REPUB_Repub16aG0023400 [Reevesia pubescens]
MRETTRRRYDETGGTWWYQGERNKRYTRNPARNWQFGDNTGSYRNLENQWGRSREDQGGNNISTVFVNNIPPEVNWRWLGQIIQNYGRVADVFIPMKRSAKGRKFGFVRFYRWEEAIRAVNSLNGVWLLDYRIGVNIARFNSRSSFWRKINPSNRINGANESGGQTDQCETFRLQLNRIALELTKINLFLRNYDSELLYWNYKYERNKVRACRKALKGQSQKVQQAVLEKFRAGGYNVIVATSIGEEGLDIMEVDLVLCFDANVSPLRMIQRMGRTGRKHDGRVDILLLFHDAC